MDVMTESADLAFRLYGLRPIAGGVDVETSSDGATDTESGADLSGEDQDQDQDREQDQQPQQQDPLNGGQAADGRGEREQAVPYGRFSEVNERMARAEMEAKFWRERAEQGQQPSQKWEVPKELQELDGHLSPYMRHYLGPLAKAIQEIQDGHAREIRDMRDSFSFYRDHPQYATGKHAKMIEDATQALTERFGRPVQRADVLSYLRGHEGYAKEFAVQPSPKQRLAADEVDARRNAGRVAGQRPAAPVRKRDAPNLEAMSPEERVKYFETEQADKPF